MSSFGLYRPYLQPMSGLGQQSRNTGAVFLGGPRAGAGSSLRIYNFYNNLPPKYKNTFLMNIRINAAKIFNK